MPRTAAPRFPRWCGVRAGELALTRFKGKKNPLRREFIMPDYVNHFRGRIRDPNEPPPAAGTANGDASGGRDASGAPPKKKANLAADEQVRRAVDLCVPRRDCRLLNVRAFATPLPPFSEDGRPTRAAPWLATLGRCLAGA